MAVKNQAAKEVEEHLRSAIAILTNADGATKLQFRETLAKLLTALEQLLRDQEKPARVD